MTPVGSEVRIKRVTVHLTNGLELDLYPGLNQVDVVMRWPSGTIKDVEHYTIDQLVGLLRNLPTQNLHDQTEKNPKA